MKKHFCILQVKDGKAESLAPVLKLLSELKDGKNIIEASAFNTRSNPQNRYLHGLLIPEFRKALNGVGYDEVKTDVQAKLILKSMFLKTEIFSKDTGEVIEYIKDTSDCSKEEMTMLIDEVIKFTAENMNYQIPYPNEQLMMNYD